MDPKLGREPACLSILFMFLSHVSGLLKLEEGNLCAWLMSFCSFSVLEGIPYSHHVAELAS